VCGGIAFCQVPEKAARVIDYFPKEKDVDNYGAFLNGGARFVSDKSSIYFCDQDENRILVFDLDGRYIKSFGRRGQGPGEFNNPLNIDIFNNELVITDNFNARIQTWSLQGQYLRQIKLVSSFFNMVITRGNIIISNPMKLLKEIDFKDRSNIEIYDMNGNLRNKIIDPFSYETNMIIENDVSMQSYENGFYCLQNHGLEFRTYDHEGKRINSIVLRYDPRKDKEYSKLKYSYTYICFYCIDDLIYAPVAWMGKIVVAVFNMKGEHIYNYVCRMSEEKAIYSVSSLKLIIKEKKYLYLLLRTPELKFLILEV